MVGVQWVCERSVKKSGPSPVLRCFLMVGGGGRIVEMEQKSPNRGWLGARLILLAILGVRLFSFDVCSQFLVTHDNMLFQPVAQKVKDIT